jgi:hypothetical protein
MSRRWHHRIYGPVLGVACLLPMVLGGWRLVQGGSGEPTMPAMISTLAPAPAGEAIDSGISAGLAIAPFRASRRASDVAYDPLRSDPALAVPVDRPPRPSLAISGLIYGARAGVVVEGIPGHDGGVLLNEGDTVAGLRIRRITVDHVVITGFDTTWTLEVRRPW